MSGVMPSCMHASSACARVACMGMAMCDQDDMLLLPWCSRSLSFVHLRRTDQLHSGGWSWWWLLLKLRFEIWNRYTDIQLRDSAMTCRTPSSRPCRCWWCKASILEMSCWIFFCHFHRSNLGARCCRGGPLKPSQNCCLRMFVYYN